MNQANSTLSDKHHQIMLLLPWYLNQSLDDAERQQVESHLRSCLVCAREFRALQKLATAVKQSSDLAAAAESSFAGLRGKLTDRTTASGVPPALAEVAATAGHPARELSSAGRMPPRRVSFWGQRALKPVALAASLLLITLPWAMQQQVLPLGSDYYTLAAAGPAQPAGAKLRVVFAKTVPEKDIDMLLKPIAGRRLEGPNRAGAYTVGLQDSQEKTDVDAALAHLRRQPGVLLAEPVVQSESP